MSLRNAIVGIAIGSVILLFVKNEEKQLTSSSAVITSTPAILSGEPVPSQTVTSVSYAPAEKKPIANHPPAGPLPPAWIPARPGRLRELLKESTAEARVESPTQAELKRFEELFLMTLQQPIVADRSAIRPPDRGTIPDTHFSGAASHELTLLPPLASARPKQPRSRQDLSRDQLAWDELSVLWSELEWDLECWTSSGMRLVAISEQSDQRRGRGIYVVRVDSLSRIALQAPHWFYDTKTGLLTRKLFDENDVLVAAWNTVHRDKVDLAHRSDHFINALTRALIRFDPSIVVVQVHGFDNEKRDSAASSASMILSDTTAYPERLVRQVAAEQKKVFGAEAVRLYPIEVSELGGTQNQQARVFHSIGRPGFLHIEMGSQLRGETHR